MNYKACFLFLSFLCCFVFQFLFQQMGMVVCFVKIHIRPYMDDIFTLIRVSKRAISIGTTNQNTNPSPPIIQALLFSCQVGQTAANSLIVLRGARHLPH